MNESSGYASLLPEDDIRRKREARSKDELFFVSLKGGKIDIFTGSDYGVCLCRAYRDAEYVRY
jgi:hypothetical protein